MDGISFDFLLKLHELLIHLIFVDCLLSKHLRVLVLVVFLGNLSVFFSIFKHKVFVLAFPELLSALVSDQKLVVIRVKNHEWIEISIASLN